jgi:hypothetical protein
MLAWVTGATCTVSLDNSHRAACWRSTSWNGSAPMIPALARYLEIATTLVTAHGGTMFAGPVLAGLDPIGRRQASMAREWEVAVPRAARMFSLNLAVWRGDPLVRR